MWWTYENRARLLGLEKGMKPYYQDDSVTIYQGDSLDLLAEMLRGGGNG